MQDRLRSRFFHIPSGKYIHSQSLVYNYGCYDLVSTKQQPNGTYYSYILTSFNTSEIIEEQCTGLKDKNGKLIYEGDIVEDKYRYKHLVKFGKHTVTIPVGYENGETECLGWYLYGVYLSCHLNPDDNYVIIGNIHENPDLLELEDDLYIK